MNENISLIYTTKSILKHAKNLCEYLFSLVFLSFFLQKKKILWICWWFGESFKFPIWFSLFFLSQSRIAKVTFSARLMLPEGALTVHVWLRDTSHNAHFKLWELKGFNNVYCLVRVLLFCLLLLSSLLFNPQTYAELMDCIILLRSVPIVLAKEELFCKALIQKFGWSL